MAQYTIDDVEILRQKSGISYEEAVNLLEYHNGSLARALVDLEKNGRIKNETSAQKPKGLKGVFDFMYRLRIKVKKNQTVIVNLSSIFVLLVISLAPHIAVIGLILALVLGYRITIDRDSQEFADEHFDDMVKNARSNVQQTMSGIARQFSQAEEKQSAPASSESRNDSAPTGKKPMNVPFSDGGSVNIRDDGDGYHEADIR